MEIWIDSCDSQVIADACRYGIIFGVTTNPSMLAKSDCDLEKVINKLLDVQDGPVAIQVVADEASAMVHQAIALHTFSDRIVVKIPLTQQGLIAMKQLSEQEISIMATAVFQPNQALHAALAGADYLAPYIGRMYNSGIDALESLQTMKTIFDKYTLKTKLIAAALQSPEQITACAAMGISAVTMRGTLFNQFVTDDPYTIESLEGFAADWEKCKHKSSILLGV